MCQLRTLLDYNDQIARLDLEPDTIKQEFGLTGKRVFNELPDVDVTKLFPGDLLHDHAEGVVPVVICISLLNIISETNLDLNRLNSCLKTFKYGSADLKNQYKSEFSMRSLRNFIYSRLRLGEYMSLTYAATDPL